MDGNEATERDPGWTPQNATPMHPGISVAGGHHRRRGGRHPGLCVRAQPADPIHGDRFHGSEAEAGVRTLAQLAAEHNDVRVWGGVHFRNSLEVGEDMGRKIAAYLVENALKPAR